MRFVQSCIALRPLSPVHCISNTDHCALCLVRFVLCRVQCALFVAFCAEFIEHRASNVSRGTSTTDFSAADVVLCTTHVVCGPSRAAQGAKFVDRDARTSVSSYSLKCRARKNGTFWGTVLRIAVLLFGFLCFLCFLAALRRLFVALFSGR